MKGGGHIVPRDLKMCVLIIKTQFELKISLFDTAYCFTYINIDILNARRINISCPKNRIYYTKFPTICGRMALILDGNSELGAHVWSDIRYLICLRHLFSSRLVANLLFFTYMRNMF